MLWLLRALSNGPTVLYTESMNRLRESREPSELRGSVDKAANKHIKGIISTWLPYLPVRIGSRPDSAPLLSDIKRPGVAGRRPITHEHHDARYRRRQDTNVQRVHELDISLKRVASP